MLLLNLPHELLVYVATNVENPQNLMVLYEVCSTLNAALASPDNAEHLERAWKRWTLKRFPRLEAIMAAVPLAANVTFRTLYKRNILAEHRGRNQDSVEWSVGSFADYFFVLEICLGTERLGQWSGKLSNELLEAEDPTGIDIQWDAEPIWSVWPWPSHVSARLSVTRCHDAATFVMAYWTPENIHFDLNTYISGGPEHHFGFEPLVLDTRCPLLHDTFPEEIWSQLDVLPYLTVSAFGACTRDGQDAGSKICFCVTDGSDDPEAVTAQQLLPYLRYYAPWQE